MTIVPVGKISEKILNKIATRIEKESSLPFREIKFKNNIDPPPQAYNSKRNQFKADELLENIESKISIPKGGRTIAITQEDLYAGSLNFVFGQARCPGETAIISLNRLKPKYYGQKEDHDILLTRATKEIIHEIGHTFGLGHCTDPKCVMSFSDSILDVDGKNKHLCKDCRNRLGS